MKQPGENLTRIYFWNIFVGALTLKLFYQTCVMGISIGSYSYVTQGLSINQQALEKSRCSISPTASHLSWNSET